MSCNIFANGKTSYFRIPENVTKVDLLKTEEGVEEVRKELESFNARKLLGIEFLNYLLENLKAQKRNPNFVRSHIKPFVRTYLPDIFVSKLKESIKKGEKIDINFNQFAFRAYIISKMHRILNNDSKMIEKL